MAASVEARKAHAAARWSALADRLRTITPETVARVAIGAVVLALAAELAVASWPALAPFAAGIVIAYAVLPIANRLDRVMPRVLAALIAELVALGVLGGVAVLVAPPLIRSLVVVASLLPTADQVTAGLDSLQNAVGQLQEPIRGIVVAVGTQVAGNLRAVLDTVVSGAAGFVTSQILGVTGTLSFVLGLLVIPAWILTMVSDDRMFRRRALGVVAPALRADVLGLARIVDRAFATFLRVRVVLSISTGLLVWLGLTAAESLGLGTFRYAVAGATLLGMLQLIPELGFFLGLFPILLVLVVQGPAPALITLVVYWGAAKLASLLVEDRVSAGVLDVHPALLIPGIVVLSQFGLGWTLAAAPLIAVGRDVVRYVAGRLAEPPAPAGVLPGERTARRSSTPAAVPVPTAYRSLAGRAPAPAGRAAAVATTTAAAGAATPGGPSPSAVVPPSSRSVSGVPSPLSAAALPEPIFTPSYPPSGLALGPVTERSTVS